tara:strand:+ start:398 stop:550 length:153 start_codon:yes stop_codon:yes gene_type:complete
METLKIDKTRLKTIKSYADSQGVTVQGVYKMVKEKRIETEKIDGVVFIKT